MQGSDIMTRSRTIFLLTFSLLLMINAASYAQSIGGLVSKLKETVPDPFVIIGRIKELHGNRVIVGGVSQDIGQGQELLVCRDSPDVPIPLRPRSGWLRVDGLIKGGFAGEIVQDSDGIKVGDVVVTPPLPPIAVKAQSGMTRTSPEFAELVRSLISAGFEVRRGLTRGPTDFSQSLVAVLEKDGDNWVCEISAEQSGRVIIVGSGLRSGYLTERKPIDSVASSKAEEGRTEQVTHKAASFKKASSSEPTEFHLLKGNFTRIVAFKGVGKTEQGIAALGEDELVIFRPGSGSFREDERIPFPKKGLIPLHIHAIDLDGKEGDELLVTLAEPIRVLEKTDSKISSWILGSRNNKLATIADNLPYYLRVIVDREGKKLALAQKKGAFRQYEGPISKISWDSSSNTVQLLEPYGPARGVAGIYQFNLVKGKEDHLMIIEKGGRIHGYFAPEEKVVASSERDLGAFMKTAYPIKLEQEIFLGGFDRMTHQAAYTARRFEARPDFDGQIFTIYDGKQGPLTGFAAKALGKGEDHFQIVGLKWIAERIVESWKSTLFYRDLLDFTFLDDPSRLIVLLRDNDACTIEILK